MCPLCDTKVTEKDKDVLWKHMVEHHSDYELTCLGLAFYMKGFQSNTDGLKEIIKRSKKADPDAIQSGVNRALFHDSQPVADGFDRPQSQNFEAPHEAASEMVTLVGARENPFIDDLKITESCFSGKAKPADRAAVLTADECFDYFWQLVKM